MIRTMIAALVIAAGLAACAPVDPCTSDPASPTCRSLTASTNATIAAIEADRARVGLIATQEAIQGQINLKSQQAQGEINTRATVAAVAIQATAGAAALSQQATAAAIETDRIRRGLEISATLEARARGDIATSTAIAGRSNIAAGMAGATATAVAGEGLGARATVESSAAGPVTLLAIVGSVIVGIVFAVALTRSGTRAIAGVAEAAAVGAQARAGSLRFGPQDTRLAIASRGADGSIRWDVPDQILGGSSDLLRGLTIDQLVAAIVEADKRRQLTFAAAYTGRPWSVSRATGGSLPAANEAPALAGPSIAGELSAPARPPAVPTFAQMLQHFTPDRDRVLLGFDPAGDPVYRPISKLLSGLIIGRQDQGKTTLLRLLFVQCVMVGVRPVVWDPHADLIDDLPGAESVTTAAGIEQSVAILEAELEDRIAKRDRGRTGIMVLADEANRLIDMVPTARAFFARVANEGRKFGVWCMLSAKGIPADMLGGSVVRDAFSLHGAFNSSVLQTTKIGIELEAARVAPTLPPGHVLIDGPIPPTVLAVPNCTPDDVRSALAAKLAGSGPTWAPDPASRVSSEVDRLSDRTRVETASEVASEVDPAHVARRERVKALLTAGGYTATAIIREVWGVESGRAFQVASREYQDIIRSLIG